MSSVNYVEEFCTFLKEYEMTKPEKLESVLDKAVNAAVSKAGGQKGSVELILTESMREELCIDSSNEDYELISQKDQSIDIELYIECLNNILKYIRGNLEALCFYLVEVEKHSTYLLWGRDKYEIPLN